jgi:hypothetical protein
LEIAAAVQHASNQNLSSGGLKKDQIALVHTAANVSAEFGARGVGEWGCCNPLAMLTDIADKAKGNGGVVCRDGVADLLKIQLSLARKTNTHQRWIDSSGAWLAYLRSSLWNTSSAELHGPLLSPCCTSKRRAANEALLLCSSRSSSLKASRTTSLALA